MRLSGGLKRYFVTQCRGWKTLLFILFFLFSLLQHLSFATKGGGSSPQSEDLTKVSELIKSGELRKGLSLLQSVRPIAEERGLYHLLYAKVLIGLNRYYEAFEHLQRAVSYGTGRIKEEAHFKRADLYARMRFYPEATVAYRLLLRLFPESQYKREAFYGIAESLRAQGLYQEALKYYEMAGDSMAVQFGKANTLHLMGRISEANKLYIDLLLRDTGFIKTSPETRLYIGENRLALGRYEEAIRYLTSVKEAPLRYRAYLDLGILELKRNRPQEALKYFEQILHSTLSGEVTVASGEVTVPAVGPSLRQKALLMSAESLIRLGRSDEAMKRLIALRSLYPYGEDYERALLLQAEIYRKGNKLRESARTLLPLILKRDPSQEAMRFLKDTLLEAGRSNREEFITIWRDFSRLFLDPSNTDFLFRVAELMGESKKEFFELSSWLFRKTKGEEKRRASFLMAQFYLSIGDVEKAFTMISNIIPLTDREQRTYAMTLVKRGDYKKGLDHLIKIKELKQEDIPTLMTISLYTKEGRVIELLKRLIDKYGADASSYVRLADLLYERGKRDDALKYYRIALSDEKKRELTPQEMDWTIYRVSVITGEDSGNKTAPFSTNLTGLLAEETLLLKRLKEDLYGSEASQ